MPYLAINFPHSHSPCIQNYETVKKCFEKRNFWIINDPLYSKFCSKTAIIFVLFKLSVDKDCILFVVLTQCMQTLNNMGVWN